MSPPVCDIFTFGASKNELLPAAPTNDIIALNGSIESFSGEQVDSSLLLLLSPSNLCIDVVDPAIRSKWSPQSRGEEDEG